MAVRSIAVTDTLETFRTEFNGLAANDFGDIATLDSSLSASSVIGAVNELSAQVSAAAGFFIEDASSTRQQVGAGETMRIFGTSNMEWHSPQASRRLPRLCPRPLPSLPSLL